MYPWVKFQLQGQVTWENNCFSLEGGMLPLGVYIYIRMPGLIGSYFGYMLIYFTRFRWTFVVKFFSGVYHPKNVGDEEDRLKKKKKKKKEFGLESPSEVHKMLGCLKCKYDNCIFIFRRLYKKLRTFLAIDGVIISWENDGRFCLHAGTHP